MAQGDWIVFGHPQFSFRLGYLIRGFINSDNYYLFQKALGLLFRGTLPSASEWTGSTIIDGYELNWPKHKRARNPPSLYSCISCASNKASTVWQ